MSEDSTQSNPQIFEFLKKRLKQNLNKLQSEFTQIVDIKCSNLGPEDILFYAQRFKNKRNIQSKSKKLEKLERPQLQTMKNIRFCTNDRKDVNKNIQEDKQIIIIETKRGNLKNKDQQTQVSINKLKHNQLKNHNEYKNFQKFWNVHPNSTNNQLNSSIIIDDKVLILKNFKKKSSSILIKNQSKLFGQISQFISNATGT